MAVPVAMVALVTAERMGQVRTRLLEAMAVLEESAGMPPRAARVTVVPAAMVVLVVAVAPEKLPATVVAASSAAMAD